MSTNTSNFNLALRQGSDIFNPLSTNGNFEKIDFAMQTNKENGVQAATPTVSGNTMTLADVDIVAEKTMVKFTLTSAQQVNKLASDGATYNVVGLDGASVTISGRTYVGMLTSGVFRVDEFPEEIDAATLDGHAAEYFATANAAEEAKTAAESAAAQAQAATTIAQDAKETAENAGGGLELLWEAPSNAGLAPNQTITLSKGYNNYKALFMTFFARPNTTSQNMLLSCWGVLSVSGEFGGYENVHFFVAPNFVASNTVYGTITWSTGGLATTQGTWGGAQVSASFMTPSSDSKESRYMYPYKIYGLK